MRLKQNILDILRDNKDVRRALEDLHNKSFYTIDRWIKENDPMLCHISSLNIISSYLKIEIDFLTEEA